MRTISTSSMKMRPVYTHLETSQGTSITIQTEHHITIPEYKTGSSQIVACSQECKMVHLGGNLELKTQLLQCKACVVYETENNQISGCALRKLLFLCHYNCPIDAKHNRFGNKEASFTRLIRLSVDQRTEAGKTRAHCLHICRECKNKR